MRKVLFVLILGILLVSLVSLVIAVQENGNGNHSNECTTEQDCINIGKCSVGLECTCSNNNKCYAGLIQGDNGNQEKEHEDKSNITFTPWQKRNESECLEGCKCAGAVMSCETETGKIMTIEAGRSGNIIIIITVNKTGGKEIEANTTLEIETENETEGGKNKTILKAKLSNGRKAEIKIMPDTASEKAIERLGKLNFTIQLKEVGKGNETQLAYELQAERHAKILGLFKAKMKVRAEVSAENGEIIRIGKPWWAFLAVEESE